MLIAVIGGKLQGVEAVLNNNELKLLEIDARLPSVNDHPQSGWAQLE
jgi:hypothetical protein